MGEKEDGYRRLVTFGVSIHPLTQVSFFLFHLATPSLVISRDEARGHARNSWGWILLFSIPSPPTIEGVDSVPPGKLGNPLSRWTLEQYFFYLLFF